ncbi:MAG: sxtJ [Stigonema ocellatum SAG 48.90 = DSM 106950]|nr:sxtJ [Stigonema ocellatum SAG 48.90 = DSM 106950]
MDEIKQLDQKGLREFGLLGGAIAAGLFGFLLPLLRHHSFPVLPWLIAMVLWIWAIAAPATLNIVYQIWMRIGLVLGWINTRVILSVIFFGFFTPIGMIKRLSGEDAMKRKIDPQTQSYRLVTQPKPAKSLLNPF